MTSTKNSCRMDSKGRVSELWADVREGARIEYRLYLWYFSGSIATIAGFVLILLGLEFAIGSEHVIVTYLTKIMTGKTELPTAENTSFWAGIFGTFGILGCFFWEAMTAFKSYNRNVRIAIALKGYDDKEVSAARNSKTTFEDCD